MKQLFQLRSRRREPEIMDQPDLAEGLHLQALRGLERINRWSGSARILWPALRASVHTARGSEFSVLDVATGAGDVPIRLWQLARRAGLPLQIEGCDRSPRAVAHARRQAHAAGANVRFFQQDVLAGPLPDQYDIVTCSLFLHHLDTAAAVSLLRQLAAAARRLVLINDLRRGKIGMLFAYLGTRLLTRSPVVHTDGPLSVAAAFTCAEARTLAEQAGLTGASVRPRWPCRFLLRWDRPAQAAAEIPSTTYRDTPCP